MNLARGTPDADNACLFLNALLASAEIAANLGRRSRFISTSKDANIHPDIQKKATSCPKDQLACPQVFGTGANEGKHHLTDPAAQKIRTA